MFTAQLAALLASPSAESWTAICALFEGWPDGPERDQALAQADTTLDGWPEEGLSMLSGWPVPVRAAPEAWGRRLAKGEVPRGWPLVRFLQYHDVPLTQAQLHRILGCGQLSRLTHLYFGMTGLEPPLAGALADIAVGLPRVEAISLFDSTLTGDRVADFAARLGGQLTYLNLAACRLTDNEIQQILSVPLARLRGLALPADRIGSEALDALMTSEHLPALEVLQLDRRFKVLDHRVALERQQRALVHGHRHLRRAAWAGHLTEETPAALRQRSKAAGLKGYTKLHKHGLIELLQGQWDTENPT